MGGNITLKNNEVGGMPWELSRHGTGGASVFVFVGFEGNIAVQAGFVWDVIHNMKGEEATDIGKTHWAVIQAKTRDLKVCNIELIMFI